MKYIDIEEALSVYKKTIEASGGGDMGIIKQDGIVAVLDFVRNDDYYPTITEKVNYLVFSLCTGHNFTDGNKRVALTLGVYFLILNGHYWAAANFMRAMENVVLCAAGGLLAKDDLLEYTHCAVECIDYPETLKVQLVNMLNELRSQQNEV